MSKRRLSDEDEPDTPRKVPRLCPSTPTPTAAAASHTLPYTSPSPSRPPPFQQPLPLLTFSYTPSRTLEFTNSAMRYFVDPPRGADLGYGYERWVKRPEERGRVDGLLKAWERIRSGGALGDSEVGVIAWRGVITKILTAPYEMRDGWELNVMCLEGTMYFEEHLSFAKLKEKNDMAPHHRIQSYYGYAFESWCTSDIPVQATDYHTDGWGGDVDTNVQWCSVVKTKLGGTRMVIGGEVDCVRGKYTGQTNTFVELKTSLAIRGPHDESKFEKKLLKFYFQSFLLGVPEILVGFRTPKGILTTLQSFKTMEIPRLVRGKAESWDPCVCLTWGERFLKFLKGVVWPSSSMASLSSASPCDKRKGDGTDKDEERKDDIEQNEGLPRVWRVVFTPREGVSVRLLDKEEVEDVKGGEDRVGFLPRWFWDDTTSAKECQNEAPSSPQAKAVIPPGWQL